MQKLFTNVLCRIRMSRVDVAKTLFLNARGQRHINHFISFFCTYYDNCQWRPKSNGLVWIIWYLDSLAALLHTRTLLHLVFQA